MKFGIIVQDLTAEEAANVLKNLSGESVQAVLTADCVADSVGGNEGEFDKNGMPWDERIHAGTKAKNGDGSWKRKRGVEESTVAAVEAELKSKASPVAAPFAAPAGNAPVGFAAPAVVPAVVSVPVAPAAPVAVPVSMPIAVPVVPSPVAITRDFKGLMQQISNLFAAKTIDPNYPGTIVQRINAGFGVTVATISDIANEPRYVEYAWQCLDVDGKGLKAAA